MLKKIRYKLRKNKRFIRKAIKIVLILIFTISALIYISSKIDHLSIETNIKAKEEITVDYDLHGDIYFNDTMNSNVFSNLIHKSIRDSKKSIEITMYSFDMFSVKRALERSKKNGIEVQCIFDKSKTEQHSRLFGANTPINIFEIGDTREEKAKNEEVGNFMHHKYSIFDRDQEDEKLLVGSFNYTTMQEKYDPSFIFNTKDKEIIQSFKNENDILLSGIRGHEKLYNTDYKPFNKKINYNNGFMELWFSPGIGDNSAKQKILDLIDSAEESIDIMIWRMTDQDISTALIKKAIDGIHIRLITDDFYIWSDKSSIVDIMNTASYNHINNIEIVSDFYKTLNLKNEINSNGNYFNPFLHQHTLIIDNKIALSGTNNWGYSGFFTNDEDILISNVNWWVKGFKKSFDDNYKIIRNKKLDISQNNNTYIINNEDLIGESLVIYNETSEDIKIPDICFETLIPNTRIIEIPNECNINESIVFILDKDKNVIESNYLRFAK